MNGYRLLLLFLIWSGLSGCAREQAPAPPAVHAAGRRIDVDVSIKGFQPARLSGRPGERIVLVFHYQRSAGECGKEVMVPGQSIHVQLAADKPTEVPLTLPADKKELAFACGMDMMKGTIVID